MPPKQSDRQSKSEMLKEQGVNVYGMRLASIAGRLLGAVQSMLLKYLTLL